MAEREAVLASDGFLQFFNRHVVKFNNLAAGGAHEMIVVLFIDLAFKRC